MEFSLDHYRWKVCVAVVSQWDTANSFTTKNIFDALYIYFTNFVLPTNIRRPSFLQKYLQDKNAVLNSS